MTHRLAPRSAQPLAAGARLTPQVFSSVVADIYDCALAPERWPQALERISNLVGGAYGSLHIAHQTNMRSMLAVYSLGAPEGVNDVTSHYGAEIPGLAQLAQGGMDTPISSMDLMSEAQFQETRFYNEWVKPKGLRDACMCKVAQTGDRFGIFTIVTSVKRELLSRDEHALVQLFSPHVRRAAMIGDLLQAKSVESLALARLVDSLQTPVVLTDRSGRVAQINAAADVLLADGAALAVSNGMLSAGSRIQLSGQRRVFESLAQAIAFAAQGDDSLAHRGNGLTLTLSPDHAGRTPAVVAYVLPLVGSDVRASHGSAEVAVFLCTREAAAPAVDALWATLFALTPSEVRVLQRLTQGLPTKAIANELNVAETTVATHIKHLFEKTDTAKQSELVALAAGVAPPVRIN
jgi:DNA-binding NarL/FixJ family response regulator